MDACGNCRFYQKTSVPASGVVGDGEGRCRRYPPIYIAPLPENLGNEAGWREAYDFPDECPSFWDQPMVFGCEWCGEYAPVQK